MQTAWILSELGGFGLNLEKKNQRFLFFLLKMQVYAGGYFDHDKRILCQDDQSNRHIKAFLAIEPN